MIRTLSLLALAGSLTACGSVAGSAVASLPPQPVAVATTVPSFMATLLGLDFDIETRAPVALLTITGNGVCSDFQAGDTAEAVAEDALNAQDVDAKLTYTDLAQIETAATTSLCPAYGPAYETWATQ